MPAVFTFSKFVYHVCQIEPSGNCSGKTTMLVNAVPLVSAFAPRTAFGDLRMRVAAEEWPSWRGAQPNPALSCSLLSFADPTRVRSRSFLQVDQ